MPVDSGKKSIVICDHFFLGGPVSFRGFEMRGAGPSTDGNFTGGKVCSEILYFTSWEHCLAFISIYFVYEKNIRKLKYKGTRFWAIKPCPKLENLFKYSDS